MANLSASNPKSRILDAAENAFATYGFEGASLRTMVLAAKVNLATVYYYFGSKEGLMEAVLKRRFDPLRQEHLERMNALEQQADGQPIAVEKILEAMLLPPLRLAAMAATKNPEVRRLIGRIVLEPNAKAQAFLKHQYQDVRGRFREALGRSLPAMPLPELLWRLEFIWGAMAYILCNPGNIKEKTDGLCDPLDTGLLLDQMIRFFALGFGVASPSRSNHPHLTNP